MVVIDSLVVRNVKLYYLMVSVNFNGLFIIFKFQRTFNFQTFLRENLKILKLSAVKFKFPFSAKKSYQSHELLLPNKLIQYIHYALRLTLINR
jgi:hypothetical protein